MKRLRGLLIFVLVFISTVLLGNTKSFATEVQYTNNVIPAMTSNTSPSGVASASSYYTYDPSNITYPYKAFNHSTASNTNGWIAARGTLTGWLAYEFPEARCITKYTVVSRDTVNSINEMPGSWTFEAWDDISEQWITLDIRTNISNWEIGIKKEFTFTNSNKYKKYRINITANSGNNLFLAIGELEMMESIPSPSNLTAQSGISSVELFWNPVINAQKYIVKRSTTPGGPYDKIIPYEPTATGSAITFVDKDVTLGSTYYYVVSSVVSGNESSNSNEVSATPKEVITPPDHTGNTATLILTMTNGDDKVYNVSLEDLDNFLTWYDNRSNGEGRAYYTFTKTTNIAPYLSVKEYVSFDKISSFEVKEYNQ